MRTFVPLLLLGLGAAAPVDGVPFVRAEPGFTGEACAEMWLEKLGANVGGDDVFAASGVSPAEGRGAGAAELEKALRQIGFGTRTDRAPETFLQDLAAGIPSIVEIAPEHFVLAFGFDAAKAEILFHNPGVADGAGQRWARGPFLAAMGARIGLSKAGSLAPLPPDQPVARRFTPADFARHVRALKARHALAGFTIAVETPFVVIGDEDPDTVRRRARDTVRWAADRLREEYFEKDPARILDVFLLRDAESYVKHADEFFGEEPTSPYGYYSSANGALVMNIATGGGTLVHEIVHPYVEANVPDCPPWLNEGLGSLYEQCAERGGRIVGLVNWRLEGLKEAIAAGTVPSFEGLTALDTHEFYGTGRGVHYAAARYLLLWLQENGLLRDFVRAFLAAREADPSGYRTLVKALGEKDMAAFKDRWQAWVLGLKFPA